MVIGKSFTVGLIAGSVAGKTGRFMGSETGANNELVEIRGFAEGDGG